MMTPDMVTTKKPIAGGKRTPAGRKKSKLTMAREEASRLAGRTVLLAACDAAKWNLTRVAEALELSTQADVIRALKELAPDEYDAARERGAISPGRRAEE